MAKIGRNDPCPCGSGKKFKKCCIHKQQYTETANDYEDVNAKEAGFLFSALQRLRGDFMSMKPHIKEYKKIRKMHQEILDSMVKYFEGGKFEQKIDPQGKQIGDTVALLGTTFDLNTREGGQAFYDVLVYKKAPDINCITEEYIQKHRYRKPEKIEFLECMLDSDVGLFEIISTDVSEGYAHVKEVFTGREHRITDIGLSGNPQYDSVYIYTRIITYHGISFGTGLNLAFSKTDPVIKSFIKREKKDYRPLGEFVRFVELYNHFIEDPDGINVIMNNP